MTKQSWKRAWKDYSEIVLDVRGAAKFYVVVESAIRIANTEKAVVRFNFNGVDLAITSPDDTLNSIALAYDNGLKMLDEARADTDAEEGR